MTDTNLPQNPDSGNTQDSQIRYCIELSKAQWDKHWEMILAGSAMAEYLKTLWTPHSSKSNKVGFKLNPGAILNIIGGDFHKNYAKHLSQHWFELAEPLGDIYEAATKYSTDKNCLMNVSEMS